MKVVALTAGDGDTSSTSPPRRVLGVVLAGGQSRRMGRDKAGVVVDGETMGDRACALVAGVTDAVVVSGHGRGIDARWLRLPDRHHEYGPVGGIAAALAHLDGLGDADPAWRGASLLVVPVDMPWLDAALLCRLRDAPATNGDVAGAAALLAADGRVAPLPLRLGAGQTGVVDAALAAGQRSLLGVIVRLGATLVPLDSADAHKLGNLNDGAALGLAAPAPSSLVAVTSVRLRRGARSDGQEQVAAEGPLQLLLGSYPLAVLMRTPLDDLDLARGFVLSERIVGGPAAIDSVEFCDDVEHEAARGNVIRITLAAGQRVDPAQLQRNTYVGSSCGICGKASVERAMQCAPPLTARARWPHAVFDGLADRLRGQQPLFAATGGSHAAAAFDSAGAFLAVREDVGRHNATDKVIGALALAGRWPLEGVGLLVSGRISFEIIQKALAAGIDLVVGVSAPTSLAIDLASSAGVALVGFARGRRVTIYAGAERCDLDG